MNLINNAVKYSGDNPQIEVRMSKSDGHVKVAVEDHGIGLTPEDQAKVFERFYRVKDKDFKTSGLGMGLYISAQIIHEHGGVISVESHFNEGSTFSFTLPLAS